MRARSSHHNKPPFQPKGINTYLLLFSFLRLVKYIRYEGRIALIVRMLADALSEMAHFGLFLMVVQLGFACATSTAFGTSVHGFESISSAFETLFWIGFGQERFDYNTITAVSPVYGRVIMMVYSVCLILILFNVFIAILMVVHNLDPEPDPVLVRLIRAEFEPSPSP